MLPLRYALLFGLGCFLHSARSGCPLWDDSPDEVCNAKDFEKNTKATLSNETYFLGEMSATDYRKMSYDWGTAAAFAFNKYYIGPVENLPAMSASDLKDVRVNIINPLIGAFKYSSQFADAMINPFGKAQCNMLPNEVSEHTLVPLLGHALDSLAKELTQALASFNNGTFSSWTAMKGIRSACENYIDIDRILGTASKLIGPNCDKANATGSTADVRNAMKTYAQLNGFQPGSSHSCLPSFIAEYTQNSTKAVQTLRNGVDKYAFLALVTNGFCAKLAIRTDQSGKMSQRSTEIVGSLKSGMSALDSVAPSTASPWTCQYAPAHVTWTPPTGSTTTPTATNTSVTGDHPSATPKTTGEPTEGPSSWWPSEAQVLAGKAIDESMPKGANTWEQRKEKNNGTAANVVQALAAKYNTTGYSFEALVYLPFTDAGMHCLPKADRDGFSELNRGNTNYFVKRFKRALNDEKSVNKFNKIAGVQENVLNSVFSSATGDLCKRLEKVEKEYLADGAFKSLAAVRCGYKFVWYQLGYRYFPVVGTTSKFVITSNSNDYSANCGQIIFFQ